MNELKLARPCEVRMLRMVGYRPVMRWSDSFVMMHLPRETNDNAADPLVEQVAALAEELARMP
jgi:hypothetical protein